MEEQMKDWIDGGSIPCYSLSSGHVAQSGHSCSGHPIMRAEVRNMRLIDQQCARLSHPWGYSRGNEQFWHSWVYTSGCYFRAERGTQPERCFPVSRKTPEENDDSRYLLVLRGVWEVWEGYFSLFHTFSHLGTATFLIKRVPTLGPGRLFLTFLIKTGYSRLESVIPGFGQLFPGLSPTPWFKGHSW